MTNKKVKFEIKYYLPSPTKVSYTYDEFYKEYYSPIFKQAYRYCKHYQDAEDITQEIMLRVLTRWHKIVMTSLTANVSLYCSQAHTDWIRVVHRNQQDLRSYDEMFDPEYDYNHPEDPNTDPYLVILRTQASDCMAEQLQTLGEVDRELFIKVYSDGMKTIDAAKELGISKGNADIRLFRARKKLASCINREDILEDSDGSLH